MKKGRKGENKGLQSRGADCDTGKTNYVLKILVVRGRETVMIIQNAKEPLFVVT